MRGEEEGFHRDGEVCLNTKEGVGEEEIVNTAAR